jgi:hypothetical protein
MALEKLVAKHTCSSVLGGLVVGILPFAFALALPLSFALSGIFGSGSILCRLVLSVTVASRRSILSFGVCISIIIAHAAACSQERTAELEGSLAKLLHVCLPTAKVWRRNDYVLGTSSDYGSLANEGRWNCCHERG